MIPELGKFEFPLSLTAVAGTQAAKVTANNIVVFRMSNLHPNKPGEDPDDEYDEEDPNPEELPRLKMAGIKHNGCINRVRYNCIGPTPVGGLVRDWISVRVQHLSNCIQKLDEPMGGDKE